MILGTIYGLWQNIIGTTMSNRSQTTNSNHEQLALGFAPVDWYKQPFNVVMWFIAATIVWTIIPLANVYDSTTNIAVKIGRDTGRLYDWASGGGIQSAAVSMHIISNSWAIQYMKSIYYATTMDEVQPQSQPYSTATIFMFISVFIAIGIIITRYFHPRPTLPPSPPSSYHSPPSSYHSSPPSYHSPSPFYSSPFPISVPAIIPAIIPAIPAIVHPPSFRCTCIAGKKSTHSSLMYVLVKSNHQRDT